MNNEKNALLSLILLFCSGTSFAQNQLAFPTAEGYGKYTTGGRGGKVIEVTNLNSSGSGSFAAAIGASGPRTVVFRVSGTITGKFSIKNDNITIAGQTAPGDGICIKGNLSTAADNIIIRYIRVRWDPAMGENDGIGGRYHKNIIFDHVSASWSTDETMTLYHNENTTVQWCIIAEACPKGASDGHRFGGIWGNNYGTWHHNLIAHNASRNPRWASGCGYNDYRNNVLYNWEYASSYGGEAHQKGDRRKPPIEHSTINMIANYYKPGPATDSKVRSRITAPSSRNGDADAGKWWVSDNFVEGSPSVTADNLKGVTKTSSAYRLNEPWPAMEINQQTAEEAFQSVLDHAGCSLPIRDKVDVDIIDDVRHGTAKYGNKGIIDSPSDVGGWPTLNSTTAPADSDHDGMPDAWETKNGLDLNNADDRNKVADDGYTMLETYLNSID
ncbi:polysaccharide lyase family 1 protein [Planctomycetota bacterium]